MEASYVLEIRLQLLAETNALTREERAQKRIKSGVEIVGRKHWDNEESYYLYYEKDEGEE